VISRALAVSSDKAPQFQLQSQGDSAWEGTRRSEVEEQFPDEYSAWEADPFTFAPRGGEPGLNVLDRALPVVSEIVGRHTDESAPIYWLIKSRI
jgi:probable phosphoglycerate mutase